MAKGIIYIMTTAVPGLIKIGKTGSDQFEKRMYHLESNGYANVAALKRHFAIEVEKYDEKETLLHEIFSKSQVANTELFALNKDLVVKLLASFEGRQVYPAQESKKEAFDEATSNLQDVGVPDGVYVHKNKNGDVVAKLSKDGDSYVILQGSVVALDYSKLSSGWKASRTVAKVDSKGKLLKPLECSSSSMAAAIVAGGQRNGLDFWKTIDGKNLKVILGKNGMKVKK